MSDEHRGALTHSVGQRGSLAFGGLRRLRIGNMLQTRNHAKRDEIGVTRYEYGRPD